MGIVGIPWAVRLDATPVMMAASLLSVRRHVLNVLRTDVLTYSIASSALRREPSRILPHLAHHRSNRTRHQCFARLAGHKPITGYPPGILTTLISIAEK
jgi:hypothetical protein